MLLPAPGLPYTECKAGGYRNLACGIATRVGGSIRARTGSKQMSLGTILVIILIIFLLGGFSGRFGGYGYGFGHGGIGVLGTILIIVVILVLLGRV